MRLYAESHGTTLFRHAGAWRDSSAFLFNWVMMKNCGEVGVAAFTAINYMLNLGVQMFVGLSDGIVPILSFNYGAGHLNRVKETLFLGFKTNATIGIILFCIMFFGNEFIVSQFFADGGRGQPCAEDNFHRSGSLRLRFPAERLEHSVVEFLYLAGRCTHLRTCVFAKRAVVRCAWNHDISAYFRR